jgi:hypothetical protein
LKYLAGGRLDPERDADYLLEVKVDHGSGYIGISIYWVLIVIYFAIFLSRLRQ